MWSFSLLTNCLCFTGLALLTSRPPALLHHPSALTDRAPPLSHHQQEQVILPPSLIVIIMPSLSRFKVPVLLPGRQPPHDVVYGYFSIRGGLGAKTRGTLVTVGGAGESIVCYDAFMGHCIHEDDGGGGHLVYMQVGSIMSVDLMASTLTLVPRSRNHTTSM